MVQAMLRRGALGFVLLALGALAACGGGGGGDGGSNGVSVSMDRTELQFAGFEGRSAPTRTVNLTLTAGSGTYYGLVEADVPSLFGVSFSPTGNTTATVSLHPLSSAVGRRSGSIAFKLCSDPACANVAWSRNLPYTVTVFGIDASSLQVTGSEGSPPSTRTLTITPPDTARLLTVDYSVDSGSGWLTATRRSDSAIDVTTTGVGQREGSYSGQVFVNLPRDFNVASVGIPIGFTVGSGFVAPVPFPVTVAGDATTASLAQSLPVAFNGGIAPSWTAESNVPWLLLTRSSGVGPGELRYTIDPSRMDGVPNWGQAIASVTLRAPGLSPTTFGFTVYKQWPEVHWVSPGAVPAGRASTVRVTGRGFSQLADAGRLRVAGVAAVGRVLSDTEAVLDLPPLPPGRAAVTVPNASGVATRHAAVGAASPSSLAAATVPSATGEKRSAFFEPGRAAVFAVNLTQNALVRYRLVNGNWVADSLPVANVADMAMSPDRQTLYVGSGERTLLAVDADTLQVVATHTMPTNGFGSLVDGRFWTRGMALTRDLRLWFGGNSWSYASHFDLLSGEFSFDTGSQGLLYTPLFSAPGNGSRLLVSQTGISPSPPTLTYTPERGSFVDTPALPTVHGGPTWSEDGTRVLLGDTALHDATSGALLGTVQTPDAINLGSVLSPDGRRVYTLVTTNLNSLTVEHVAVHDATRTVPGTSSLVKLGQLPVGAQAPACNGEYGCNVRGLFFVSPLGDTLFWLGNRNLVVLPVPEALAGSAAAATSQRLRPAAAR
jgi:hypothetical protein